MVSWSARNSCHLTLLLREKARFLKNRVVQCGFSARKTKCVSQITFSSLIKFDAVYNNSWVLRGQREVSTMTVKTLCSWITALFASRQIFFTREASNLKRHTLTSMNQPYPVSIVFLKTLLLRPRCKIIWMVWARMQFNISKTQLNPVIKDQSRRSINWTSLLIKNLRYKKQFVKWINWTVKVNKCISNCYQIPLSSRLWTRCQLSAKFTVTPSMAHAASASSMRRWELRGLIYLPPFPQRHQMQRITKLWRRESPPCSR